MAPFAVIGILSVCLLGITEGRKGFGPGEQEWGFVQVRPQAHMFWWMYYTTAQVEHVQQRPLLIYLQGGPGASSTGYGNFQEIGPLDSKLNLRNSTWVKDYNVLFIDNPVGAGFSYVESYNAYATTNAQIAADLLECMKGFYQALPIFRAVPVYILAESYGGKMTVQFGNLWYMAQKAGFIQSNLKGVGLGDAWISPIDSIDTWAPYLLMTGMVDTEQHNRIVNSVSWTKAAMEMQNWGIAFDRWAYTQNLIFNETINIDFYNIIEKATAIHSGKLYENTNAVLTNIMNGIVKEALGLNLTWGGGQNTVFTKLRGDFMQSVTNEVEWMLSFTDLRVFVYNGQLDLIVDTPGTLAWVNKLRWLGVNYWRNAPRRPIVANNIIEGYFKGYGNLYMYWINRAGHMVPADNPAGMEVMLRDLTSN